MWRVGVRTMWVVWMMRMMTVAVAVAITVTVTAVVAIIAICYISCSRHLLLVPFFLFGIGEHSATSVTKWLVWMVRMVAMAIAVAITIAVTATVAIALAALTIASSTSASNAITSNKNLIVSEEFCKC